MKMAAEAIKELNESREPKYLVHLCEPDAVGRIDANTLELFEMVKGLAEEVRELKKIINSAPA